MKSKIIKTLAGIGIMTIIGCSTGLMSVASGSSFWGGFAFGVIVVLALATVIYLMNIIFGE